MSEKPSSPAMDPQAVVPRTDTTYPSEFRDRVQGRRKRTLGDPLGLTHYGVNLVELPPGVWSFLRHWHSAEDEFVYVVSGKITLITDAGRQVLRAGMVAGFPAGKPDGHHLVNEGSETAVFLEIGDRNDADEVRYPDIDLELTPGAEGRVFRHKDGRPYERG